MSRSDTASSRPVHRPCTASDMDWQKMVAALSRATGRYGGLLASAGGDRAEAATQLWRRSRHDTALREDLAKSACALFALAPGAAESAAGRRGKAGLGVGVAGRAGRL